MKIDSSFGKPVVAPSSENKAGRAEKPQSPTAARRDDVTLSSASQLQSSLNSAPSVDTAKVEAIKQAIAEGRFQINPEKIADGLLSSARELLTAKG